MTPSGRPAVRERALLPSLLLLTAVTGMVDAVSFLGLGRIFTANMTGNVVFLGFALAGAPGLSAARCAMALAGFLAGALVGGRLSARATAGAESRWPATAFSAEAALLFAAVAASIGQPAATPDDPTRLHAVIILTALAMGLRNATVRSLGVPDLTTTVLTLTITGLAADSTPAGGRNPRWARRVASVLAMSAGAALGVVLLEHSLALPLAACATGTCACALAVHLEDRRRTAIGI